MGNKLVWPLSAIFIAVVVATGGVLIARSYSQSRSDAAATAATTGPAAPSRPVPAVTKTVIRDSPVAVPVPSPNVTGPWAVVSAYYGDVESHDYREAWALLSSGAVTGQTYRQFVAGYACTGAERLTEVGASGGRVRFDLRAVDDCTGRAQYYTGTDTVAGGKIVAATIRLTG
jgi:hypothetical protein